MSALDAAEVRRIAAQLATLEQQRAEGGSPHDDEPLRLYRLKRSSAFVRVLDRDPAPIPQDMVQPRHRALFLYSRANKVL